MTRSYPVELEPNASFTLLCRFPLGSDPSHFWIDPRTVPTRQPGRAEALNRRAMRALDEQRHPQNPDWKNVRHQPTAAPAPQAAAAQSDLPLCIRGVVADGATGILADPASTSLSWDATTANVRPTGAFRGGPAEAAWACAASAAVLPMPRRRFCGGQRRRFKLSGTVCTEIRFRFEVPVSPVIPGRSWLLEPFYLLATGAAPPRPFGRPPGPGRRTQRLTLTVRFFCFWLGLYLFDCSCWLGDRRIQIVKILFFREKQLKISLFYQKLFTVKFGATKNSDSESRFMGAKKHEFWIYPWS